MDASSWADLRVSAAFSAVKQCVSAAGCCNGGWKCSGHVLPLPCGWVRKSCRSSPLPLQPQLQSSANMRMHGHETMSQAMGAAAVELRQQAGAAENQFPAAHSSLTHGLVSCDNRRIGLQEAATLRFVFLASLPGPLECSGCLRPECAHCVSSRACRPQHHSANLACRRSPEGAADIHA